MDHQLLARRCAVSRPPRRWRLHLAPWVAVGVLALAAAPALADYVAARDAALALTKADEHEEAYAAFIELSEFAANDYQLSDALEHAAMSAQRLGRENEARELAARIPLAPRAGVVRMRLMAERNQWEQILEAFGDVDFTDWPGSAAAEAFHLRAKAHLEHNDSQAAMRDMLEAGRRTENAGVFFDLGNLAQSLNEDVIAMDAFRNLQRATPSEAGWQYYTSVIARADILRHNGFYELSLKELDKMSETQTGYWGIQAMIRRGEALVAMGRESEAVTTFREALAIEGIAGVQRNRIEASLKELEQ